jgi:GT2 family glycosyltransferase
VSDPHSTRPRVAIVILQWRRPEETAACLRTVAALTYQNYAVLVVDNHSADGSVARLREEFPSLAVHETAANLGFAGGCNVGIRSALADPDVDYVMLLNNDTRVPADLLDTMVAVAEADPHAAAVGAVNLCGEGHAPSGGQLHWWTGRYVDVLDRHPLASLATAPVLAVDTIAGSSMLIRASVLRAGELLDPAYFCIYEETDWCVRQRRRGGRVLLATRARLEHKGSGTMGRPLQLYYRFRNRPYFMAKHANPAHWVTFLPYYVGEAAGRIIGYALAGRRKEARGVLLGVLDAARGVRGPGRIAELTF